MQFSKDFVEIINGIKDFEIKYLTGYTDEEIENLSVVLKLESFRVVYANKNIIKIKLNFSEPLYLSGATMKCKV